MDTGPDVTRIVRSWLRTDEHESADRVLGVVLDQLDTTRQRRSWWPARRIADMNAYAKILIAAAAVVVVAVVGINLLPAGGGVGGVPAASPSPSATPAASPPPSPGLVPPTGELAIGSHHLSQSGVGFTLDIAKPGWVSSGVAVAPDGVNFTKGPEMSKDGAWMLFWSVDGVYADPCGHVEGPVVSPSAADLAAAVAALPGASLVTGPTDVTVGGNAAKYVEITIPDDIGCAPDQFYLWYDAAGCGNAPQCYRWVSALGETNRVWIVEVGGQYVWVEAETYKGAGPEIEQEIQQIIDSIQFE